MEQTQLFGKPFLIVDKQAKGKTIMTVDIDDSERKQAAIKAHFLKGKTLTVLQAIKQFHTTELRKVICRLKNQGMDIVGNWYEENGKRKYKVYGLKSEP